RNVASAASRNLCRDTQCAGPGAVMKNMVGMNMKFLRMILLTMCGVGVLGSVVAAQTVKPVIAELGNPAKGRIEYYNDSLKPLNVVLETKSFTVSDTGEITYRPLDTTVHLKLSATSFRVMPQQSYYVFYEADTAEAPAWFVVYAAFSGFPFRTQQGMNI